ncbi:hypothetical protein [Streptomyces formicae]|uniref:Uncharacterized protein n=1 Tax=Streptomyces formicae TaxID=1616117 RepID=A0ABY3WE26_9ACTN|nr:hypothetical protein [Streptomyces formicae]UNM10819.1 hypothetical protein J4032_04180 [Streptomyces formicae]
MCHTSALAPRAVIFGLGSLAGVADVRFGADGGGSSECKITGTLGICTDSCVWPGLNSQN